VPAPCFSEEEVREALGVHGSFEVCEECEEEVVEGEYHTGKGWVLNVVWRKGE
jgi:hypothetical protein